jgi:hypothetical protein
MVVNLCFHCNLLHGRINQSLVVTWLTVVSGYLSSHSIHLATQQTTDRTALLQQLSRSSNLFDMLGWLQAYLSDTMAQAGKFDRSGEDRASLMTFVD